MWYVSSTHTNPQAACGYVQSLCCMWVWVVSVKVYMCFNCAATVNGIHVHEQGDWRHQYDGVRVDIKWKSEPSFSMNSCPLESNSVTNQPKARIGLSFLHTYSHKEQGENKLHSIAITAIEVWCVVCVCVYVESAINWPLVIRVATCLMYREEKTLQLGERCQSWTCDFKCEFKLHTAHKHTQTSGEGSSSSNCNSKASPVVVSSNCTLVFKLARLSSICNAFGVTCSAPSPISLFATLSMLHTAS